MRVWSQHRLIAIVTLFALSLIDRSASAQLKLLPGQFAVGATGAATYSIPIAVPPGTAGMVPVLSLDYSSQGGNGVLGVGWSLGGLPALGRCAQTVAQDGIHGGINYDGNDRFCLDGQRLVAINGGTYGADGTEYRLEVEAFSRIISHGTAGTGPAWFEVHTKSGQVMEFGNTADLQILAQGQTTARSWAVNKVSDTKGNYFTVTYTDDTTNGVAYPSEIDYTGNSSVGTSPYNKVQFAYAPRPDITPFFQAGSLVQTTLRLSDVKTFVAGASVSDYQIAYQQSPATQRSEITAISLCSADGNCIPATAMNWQAGSATGSLSTSVYNYPAGWNFAGAITSSPRGIILITGDFNGDGRTDFLMFGGATAEVFLSNGDGTFAASQYNYPAGWNFSGAIASNALIPVVGDFNGDGKADFLIFGATTADVFLSNGDGTFSASQFSYPEGWNFAGAITSSPPGAIMIAGDFNGDGKSDFLMFGGATANVFLSNGDGTFSPTQYSYPAGWNFAGAMASNAIIPVSGDFNGDGKADILIFGSTTADVFLSNGDGTFMPSQFGYPSGWNFAGAIAASAIVPVDGDFNGDGKTDFLMFGGAAADVFLSNGDGTFLPSQFGYPAGWNFSGALTSSPRTVIPVVGDFNGDGRTDFIMFGEAGADVFASNGDGTFLPSQVGYPAGWNFSGAIASNAIIPVIGDFNGDGMTDFLMFGAASANVFLASGPIPDYVTSISTGLGAMTTITYQPITSGNVYSKDNTAVYPTQDVQTPLYVTSRVGASNGIGGTYSSTYSYAGAKLDLSGRGFLGFRQKTVTDLQTNIVQTANYRQDFPYIGLIGSGTKAVSGGSTLNSSVYSYQFLNAANAATVSVPSLSSAPYRVSLSESVESSADLDGTQLPTVTTAYQYDPYNNPTQIGVSTPDGTSKTTSNTYTNDTTNWFLGRLTGATVTSTLP